MRTLILPVCLLAFIAAGTGAEPLSAQSSDDSSLHIQGVLAEYTMAPGGQTLAHHMVVTLGAAAPRPMDVQVEVRGLGEGPDGAILPLTAEEDTSPYSARSFIKSIDAPGFRLSPGASKEVNATIVVPADATHTSRYADIYIHTLPIQGASLDVILGANVPVLLQPRDGTPEDTAHITSVEVAPVVSGRPIVITSTVKNTGNHHFKTTTKTSLIDPNGNMLATADIPFTGASMLPTYSRNFVTAFGFLSHVQGLPVGNYFVETVESLPDGTLLDVARVPFRIATEYRPFGDIDPADLVIVNYNDEVPYPIDARKKTDLELSFSGVGKVTGTVVLGKYRTEPSGRIPFGATAEEGGSGRVGAKFVGVGIEGFKAGTSHMTMHYASDEAVRFNPTSFVLGLRTADKWSPLAAFSSLPGSQVVSGDISVSVLNDNPVIGLGGELQAPRVNGVQVVSGIPLQTVILLVVGITGAAGLILVLVIWRLRGRGQPPTEWPGQETK